MSVSLEDRDLSKKYGIQLTIESRATDDGAPTPDEDTQESEETLGTDETSTGSDSDEEVGAYDFDSE